MIAVMSKDHENGDTLWKHVTKDVRKLDAPERSAPEIKRKRIKINPVLVAPALPALKLPSGGGIDRKTEERVRKGQVQIEARLDLHGHTIDMARAELLRFVAQSFALGFRCILVITGKGRLGQGVIKREFGLWLEDPSVKAYILSVSQAQPKHGGSGAHYIYLRKNRS